MIPIKNAREIEKMRQACRTASDILDRVRDLVRPGITTKEVDEAAAQAMRDPAPDPSLEDWSALNEPEMLDLGLATRG